MERSHIWVIEDDPQIAKQLQDFIHRYGFEVKIADQFDDIMGQFRSIRPDLVLLDINLPKYDGFYWCRQIRMESNCPILFISARESKMDQVWVHQMKTPLSVIDMILQTEDHPTFNRLHIEMEKMKKGLEMVLYTSRFDHFEHDFYVERLDLQQVVQRVMRENKSMFIYHHVYPQMLIDEKVFVYSDEKWIAFVFSQLLTNAVKYTKDQGGRIEISIYRQEDEHIFEVKDQGIGIPKRDQQRVFEPYFTGRQGRIYSESTGMGLYLAKEICQRLNHRIELESEEGLGTVVRIRFSNTKTYK